MAARRGGQGGWPVGRRRRQVDQPFFPERLIWWLSFQIVLSLLPLLFEMANGGTQAWSRAVSRGEMVLIAVVLAGGDVGAAAPLSPATRWRKLARAAIVGFGSVFCIIGAVLFAIIRKSAESLPAGAELADMDLSRSYTFFVVAIIIGISTLYLVHVEEIAGRGYGTR
jgi:hypothetical protein